MTQPGIAEEARVRADGIVGGQTCARADGNASAGSIGLARPPRDVEARQPRKRLRPYCRDTSGCFMVGCAIPSTASCGGTVACLLTLCVPSAPPAAPSPPQRRKEQGDRHRCGHQACLSHVLVFDGWQAHASRDPVRPVPTPALHRQRGTCPSASGHALTSARAPFRPSSRLHVPSSAA